MDSEPSQAVKTYKIWDEAPYQAGEMIDNLVMMSRNKGGDPNTWPYTIKILHFKCIDDVASQDAIAKLIKKKRDEFRKEVHILRIAKHHHVVEFVDAFELAPKQNSVKFHIVMKNADDNLRRANFHQLRGWLHCLASVVDYIHSIGIRHRDIKPENILVHQNRILLADFGISRIGFGETLSTTNHNAVRSRTPMYCAPEVEDGGTRGRPADIFSLGLVFLEMLHWHSYHQDPRFKEIVGLKTRFAERLDEMLPWMEEFGGTFTETQRQNDWRYKIFSICRKMLSKDRESRPTSTEVLRQTPKASDCSCDSPTGDAAFILAIRDCALQEIKDMVDNNRANLKTKGAIQQASAHGRLSVVDYLLEQKVDIDATDYSHQTALHCAVSSGNFALVKYLLDRKARVELADIEGRTPLHCVAGRRNLDEPKNNHARGTENLKIANLLLKEAYINPWALDEANQTPLHFAAKRGHAAIVEALLAKVNPEETNYVNKADNKKTTALHYAASSGSQEVVCQLLDNGADQNAQDDSGSTALHRAAASASQEVVYKLLKNGACPNVQNKKKATALHLIVRNKPCEDKHVAIVKMLVEHGVEVDKEDEQNNTAWYYASDWLQNNIRGILNQRLQEAKRDPALSHEESENPAANQPQDASYLLRREAESSESRGEASLEAEPNKVPREAKNEPALSNQSCKTIGLCAEPDYVQLQESQTEPSRDEPDEQVESPEKPKVSDVEGAAGSKGKGGIANTIEANECERYSQAASYLTREVERLERRLGDNHWKVFELKTELIRILSAQGKLQKATAMSEALDRGTKERYSTSNTRHARAGLILADLYMQQSRWDDGEQKLLSVKNEVANDAGSEHLLHIEALKLLFIIYKEKGSDQEAKNMLDQLSKLAGFEKNVPFLTEEHAAILERSGRRDDAQRLGIWINQMPHMADEIAALNRKISRGQNARKKGDPKKAEKVLRESMEDAKTLEAKVGEMEMKSLTMVIIRIRRILALAIRDQGRLAEAEEMQRSLKALTESELAEMNRKTLKVIHNLALTLEMAGKPDKAEELLLLVKEGWKRLPGLEQ